MERTANLGEDFFAVAEPTPQRSRSSTNDSKTRPGSAGKDGEGLSFSPSTPMKDFVMSRDESYSGLSGEQYSRSASRDGARTSPEFVVTVPVGYQLTDDVVDEDNLTENGSDDDEESVPPVKENKGLQPSFGTNNVPLHKEMSVDSLHSVPSVAQDATTVGQLAAILEELTASYRSVRAEFDDFQKDYEQKLVELNDRMELAESESVIKSQEIDKLERVLRGEMVADRRVKPTRTGWIALKVGGAWKEKWFILQGFNLMYFNEEYSEIVTAAIKGAIIMNGAHVIMDPIATLDRTNSFCVHCDSGKEYFLSTNSAEERNLWVNDIRAAVCKADIAFFQRVTRENQHLRGKLHLADWVFVRSERDKGQPGLHRQYAILTSHALLLFEEQPTPDQVGRLHSRPEDKFVHPVKACFPLKGLFASVKDMRISCPEVRAPHPDGEEQESPVKVLRLVPSTVTKLPPLILYLDQQITPFAHLNVWERTIKKWALSQADIKVVVKAGNMLAWRANSEKGAVTDASGHWTKRFVVFSQDGLLYTFKERPEQDHMLTDIAQLSVKEKIDVKKSAVSLIAVEDKEYCIEIVEGMAGFNLVLCAGVQQNLDDWVSGFQKVARFRLNKGGAVSEVGPIETDVTGTPSSS